MAGKALLVLEDGTVFQGRSFGAASTSFGEVVFNTSMTGYQEMLTDPSYAGQIVMPTYPLIGNYGINDEDFESAKVQVSGFVVREHCELPSHWQSTRTLHQFLESQGIPAISGIDTRALTRRLRSRGVMMGVVTSSYAPGEALEFLKRQPAYGDVDLVQQVTAPEAYDWDGAPAGGDRPTRWDVTLIDLGLKYNVARILHAKGCRVTVVPARTSPEEVLAAAPDGVVLSPGPGDPALLEYMTATAKGLVGRVPVMGICLGHQVLAHALGCKTYKLKFGHRGGNHPVRDLATGRIQITAQNHGYAVDPDSLPPEVTVSHVNLNDGTVEGIRHRSLPLLSIQYHSEASPGPMDNVAMFDRFLDMVGEAR